MEKPLRGKEGPLLQNMSNRRSPALDTINLDDFLGPSPCSVFIHRTFDYSVLEFGDHDRPDQYASSILVFASIFVDICIFRSAFFRQ